jgi:hypothetical protein
MGLSIYYKGRIRDRALLPQLTEAVIDVCETMGWDLLRFDKPDANGVAFTPPGCELISLTFDLQNQITDVRLVLAGLEPIINGVIVKTQYAGVDAHRAVIRFFRWLAKEYFDEFEMFDESRYWETGDEEVLLETFARYDMLINSVATALENFPVENDEATPQMADRLARFLQDQFGTDVRLISPPGNE